MITVLMFLRHFKALLNRAWGTWCSVKIWLMSSCHSYLSVHKIPKKKGFVFQKFLWSNGSACNAECNFTLNLGYVCDKLSEPLIYCSCISSLVCVAPQKDTVCGRTGSHGLTRAQPGCLHLSVGPWPSSKADHTHPVWHHPLALQAVQVGQRDLWHA